MLSHCHVRVQRIVLEHHRHVPFLRRLVVDLLAADPQDAAGDVLQPGDHPQRRGLAAARRPTSAMNLPSPMSRLMSFTAWKAFS